MSTPSTVNQQSSVPTYPEGMWYPPDHPEETLGCSFNQGEASITHSRTEYMRLANYDSSWTLYRRIEPVLLLLPPPFRCGGQTR